MRIDVITLFPTMVATLGEHGITARACDRGLLALHAWNPRDDTLDRHRSVDDRPYGGGPGMVMKVQPLQRCLQRVRAAAGGSGHAVYLSPQGRRLDQAGVYALSQYKHLILLAGRYEGVDERLIEAEIDAEWSIGDYVLSGGELAAMVLIDAVTRLLPGALGDEGSAAEDSFSLSKNGQMGTGLGLLDYPHYTRPETINGQTVPQVLLSGDHDAIRRWRLRQALGRTWLRRPDILQNMNLDAEQRALLDDFIREYKQLQTGASA